MIDTCGWQDPLVSHVEPDRTIRLTRSDPCLTAQPSLTAAYTDLADAQPEMAMAAEKLFYVGRKLSQTSSLQPLIPGAAPRSLPVPLPEFRLVILQRPSNSPPLARNAIPKPVHFHLPEWD